MRIRNVIQGLAVLVAFGMAVLLWAQAPTQQGGARPVTPAAQAGGRGGRGGGPGRTSFPQQQRDLASPAVIARGKVLYQVNCVSCHGADLRGGDQGGPNLLVSQVALSDQHGEHILPIVRGAREPEGMPAFNMSDPDVVAVAEYIHSVLAQVGRQGRPPGNGDQSAQLKVIVGDPVAGKTYFNQKCASCHSISGDLAGIGAKYTDGRTLQNTWVGGQAGGGRGGFGGGGGNSGTVTVTMANDQKVQGKLVQANEFVVTLIEANGVRRTITRDANVASVQVRYTNQAHRQMALTLDDTDMHNVTAYLATVQ